MIYRDLTLNYCRDNMLRIKVTQREHGAVTFKISLFNGNERIELTDCKEAVYYATKPDNHVIGNACQIEDDFVLLPLTSQMTAVHGKLVGVLELQFETGNIRFSGVNFEVFPSPESVEIESTDEFTILEKTIAEVRKIVEEGLEFSTGKSAYEVAVDNGFEGSEDEWLESLKGENGKDGIGISKSEIIDGELVLTFSDNTVNNLGVVVGANGQDYVLTDKDKQDIANIVKTDYDQELLTILGGDENAE